MQKLFSIFVFLFSIDVHSLEKLIPANCISLKKTSEVHLQKCDSLYILWLTGSPIQRARQHGELLKKEFSLDNLDLFVNLSLRGLEKNSFRYHLTDFAANSLVKWAHRGAPASYLNETAAMADAAGLEAIQLRRALMLPDIAAYSWALLSKQGENLTTQGCTSALYSDKKGNFLQGRNLDFPGSPSYDKNPVLVVHKPEAGSQELKHVSIGSQGVQFSGITGFNEAGITFAVHQNYTRLLSIKGTPMPYVGELVLRSAKNLDEAVQIIKKNRPGPLWSFVLSDLKTQEALTVEVSNTHFAVRKKESPYFAQTNHIVSAMKTELALMDAGTFYNSGMRFQKVLTEMQTWKNPEAKHMAQLLAWQKSQVEFSPISDVLKSLTIQSVLYEVNYLKKLNNFYVTLDSAPAAAGRWAQFNLDTFWKQNSIQKLDMTIHDFVKTTPKIRALQKKWTEIYSYEIMRHYDKVVELLEPLASTPDGFLALSAMQLKSNRPMDSLVSAQKGLKSVGPSDLKLISQGLQWMEIVSLWQMNKKDLVQIKALSLFNQGIEDPELEKQARLLMQKKEPSLSSLSPGFDFFGGYLQGMPSRRAP